MCAQGNQFSLHGSVGVDIARPFPAKKCQESLGQVISVPTQILRFYKHFHKIDFQQIEAAQSDNKW